MAVSNQTHDGGSSADLQIALGLLLVIVAAFGLGLIGLCLTIAVASILPVVKANLQHTLIALLVVVALIAGLYLFGFWTPQIIYLHPQFLGQLIVYSWQIADTSHLQKLWLNSFGYTPLWQVLHGAVFGFLIRLLQIQYDRINPVWASRRRKAQARKQQHQSNKKPRFRNADKMPADKPEENVIGNEALSGKLVTLTDKSINTHALVVGTTGGGKTVTVLNLVESFINRGLPVLYIDGKGDRALGTRICDYARQHGRRSKLFSMTGESVTYNPLAGGSYTSKKDRIIEIREWTEPHYKTLAEGFLQMVFSVLETLKEPVNFLNVAEYLDAKPLIALVKQKDKDGSIDQATTKRLLERIKEESTTESEVKGMIGDIRNLANSEIGHLFEVDPVKNLVINDSLKRGEVVYMGINPLKFPAFAGTLGKLIVNDFKSGLEPDKPQKILVVFDEFGVFAGDQVLNIINQGRSAGVCAVLTVQSTSDIGRNIINNSEQFIEQVFSNCNNYLIHRVNSANNAEELAKIIGTDESEQITERVSDGQGFAGEGSMRTTREFLYHPDQIKNLRTGEAIYLNRNNGFHTQVNVRMSKI